MHKNKFNLFIMLLVISSIVLTGCMSKAAETEELDTKNNEFEYQAIPVKAENVVSDDVYKSVYTIGEIKAYEQYQVNAMTNGNVLEIFYTVGDFVEEGAILFTIEATDFEVDKNINLSQALNAVSQAKLSLDSANKNYSNYKILFDNGVSSKADLDNMSRQYDNAKISYSNALKSYESVKHNYESMSDNYQVTSPVSGIITSTNVAKDMFATTQNGFSIAVVDRYKVSSQVASKYINEIKVGQEVEIYVSTLDAIISGSINSISLNGVNGAYPIEITLNNNNTEIKPGMYADIWIIMNKTSQGLWIPSQALLQEKGESFVYTIIEGKAKKIIVEILTMRGTDIAVTSELTKDSKIITLGKEFVMNGTPVEEKK